MTETRQRVLGGRAVALAALLWGLLTPLVLLGQSTAGAAGPQRSHDLEVELGAGFDSNPFLSPDAPYFDLNQERLISPERRSGFLWPVRLDGDLTLPFGSGDSGFVAGYRFRSALYTDSSTSNADEVYVRIDPGVRFDLGRNTRRDRVLDVRGFASYDKEVYFDRDTGLPATSSGIDLADRFTYSALGAEASIEYEATRSIAVNTEFRVETRSYRDVSPIESFDQDRYRGQVEAVFRLSRSTRLYLDYRYEQQRYAERRARSADGNDTLQNPLLEYAHTTLGTSLRFKPAAIWTLEFGLSRRNRADRFVGYNDYTQDRLRVRATLATRHAWARLTASYWEREFDRAFIFDRPIDPRTGMLNANKSYETLDVEFHGYLPWKKHLRPFTRIRYVDQQAVDPRFAYDRSQIMTGLEMIY